MPTDPSTQSRPGRDDAYVVDTRRRPKRAAGGAVAPSRVDDRGAGPDTPTRDRGYRWRRGRIALVVLLVLLVAGIGFMVWVPMQAWGAVNKVDNIPDGQRPTDTSGYNYLLVGSDSREGLSKEQRKKYATGNAAGNRTDTIMLVHVSESGGKPVMVSLPRDSYVPIPGHGSNKINAAYSIGGPKLLTETVEQVTGIHVDGYVEIGLGGFAAVVDSVGGVDLCVPRNMKDKKAGIDLKKGCQTLDGGNALGYVRSRYEDPLGDIGRAARQRQFLGALMKKAATPSTVLIPWRYKSFADASAAGLAVGSDTGIMDAVRVLQAMRAVSNDEGLSLSVPTSDLAYRTNAGALAVKWDTERAKALFQALKDDEPLTEPPAGTTVQGATNS
jgi:LCP family protein required for cell wall assembly